MKSRTILTVAALCLIAFAAGWFIKATIDDQAVPPLPLRLGGYQFISPLVSCNSAKFFPQASTITSDIQSVIQEHEQVGDITKASTYFADFSKGPWSVTNPQATYYPSSIGKVPIMMAYYVLAESTSSILDQMLTYPGGTDLNDDQQTKPSSTLIAGQSYSVEDLIERMVRDSDNNAAALLYNAINKDALQNVYDDLGIPTGPTSTTPSGNIDFITPQQISVLFRVLYNATYLSRDYSEKALQLMSESTFTQGLVAGVPSSTVVAHKFGIVSIDTNGIPTERELHDCGIVYAPNHPYTLCVMTRGPATDANSLQAMEQTISDISNTVYQDVENGKE